MTTDKDFEQDELIRSNAERIARNEAEIKRQTEALEMIRDHYYPKKTMWKSACGFLLKVVGAITIYTGMMEATEWYVNTSSIERMAERSATVAERLMFEENDPVGAVSFLQRAVELDGNNAKYRTTLGFMKGAAAVVDLFETGRPLAVDERERVDAILSDAVFLQTSEPENPLSYVLAAQAYVLRQEFALATQSVARAVALAPKNGQVHCSNCAIRFFTRDIAGARKALSEAARLRPDLPIVHYWQGMLSAYGDGDFAQARKHFEFLTVKRPRFALPHVMIGWTLLHEPKPDLPGARAELEKALGINPNMKRALFLMAEVCEREGDLIMARLWLDRALERDGRYMAALKSRARISGELDDLCAAEADWSAAIKLDAFQSEIYRARAKAREKLGDAVGAASDNKTAAALERRGSTTLSERVPLL